MATSPIRVLVADDFAPFRRLLLSALQNIVGLQDVREVSDGLEAVKEAQRLQPDLILLDIGLPTLNGLEVARQIRKLSPTSKIVFVTQESSADVVQEALHLGAQGYVVKTDVANEILDAVTAVLRGEQFVGRRFAGHDFTGNTSLRNAGAFSSNTIHIPSRPTVRKAGKARHEVQFYSDEESFLAGFTQFIGTALRTGSAVIVIATESHRESLLPRLHARGINMNAAIDQRRYIPLDCENVLSRFMFDGLPDPARLFKFVGDLIDEASGAAGRSIVRVVACGELAPLLLTQGRPESAIRVEQLWDPLAAKYGLDTLCGYSLGSFHGEQGRDVFQHICALHSVVHSQ